LLVWQDEISHVSIELSYALEFLQLLAAIYWIGCTAGNGPHAGRQGPLNEPSTVFSPRPTTLILVGISASAQRKGWHSAERRRIAAAQKGAMS
jgi:hypothetical protein